MQNVHQQGKIMRTNNCLSFSGEMEWWDLHRYLRETHLDYSSCPRPQYLGNRESTNKWIIFTRNTWRINQVYGIKSCKESKFSEMDRICFLCSWALNKSLTAMRIRQVHLLNVSWDADKILPSPSLALPRKSISGYVYNTSQ